MNYRELIPQMKKEDLAWPVIGLLMINLGLPRNLDFRISQLTGVTETECQESGGTVSYDKDNNAYCSGGSFDGLPIINEGGTDAV